MHTSKTIHLYKMRDASQVLLASAVCLVLLAVSAAPVLGDSTMPVNYVATNFGPISTPSSFDYNFTSGSVTAGSTTASVYSTSNAIEDSLTFLTKQDPPKGFGTFIGTAHPVRFDGLTAVTITSTCPTGFPACFSDGTFTFGNMVTYNTRGETLDHLTHLATQYYLQHGCFGGGSPRFDILMSNGKTIHVYLGTPPAFADCPPPGWASTGNLATDSAGLRWDSSQIGGTFYGLYSEAVTLADAQGLTISAIFISVDGGWFGTNPTTGQTVLFHAIQLNDVTRFPN